ncbi:MAG: hypothetical protein LQ345_002479 [Seirophora villosa]|nr:MAG: hypothetical protein LQ345_002479 [Seirophora villosa]
MHLFPFVLASCLNGIAVAIQWIEPLPTRQHHLADAGVSPRPTDAPGSNGIPKELRRRQQNVLYPPPDNWCGFIEGDYDLPLTCRPSYTCVNSDTAVGCCPNTLAACTNIYTTCHDFAYRCDSDCEANDKIRKCSDSEFPYCGTYSFSIGTYLYNCEASTNLGASSVEQLADFYITAISSSFSLTSAAAAAPSATSTSLSTSSSSSTSNSDDGGLSGDAIRGIAIGVSIGVCAIFMLVAIFIIRKRRANRRKRASRPNPPPAYSPGVPMQPTPQVYRPVPQQDQSYAPTQAGYFPHSGPGKGGAGVIPHPDLSPGQKPPLPQRHSTANSSLLSPNSAVQGSGAAAGRDSYKIYSPTSPTLTEVDGSERPLPEADSIQRPLSNHTGTGMVSPIEASSGTGSPPPTNGQSSYVDPRPGTYEVAPTQPYLGPYEMPHQRYRPGF